PPDTVNGVEGEEAAAKSNSKFPEVDERRSASRRENIPFQGRMRKIMDYAKRAGASLTRSQVHLPNTAEYAHAHHVERQKQEADQWSIVKAISLVQNKVMSLLNGPNQTALFESYMTTRAMHRNRNMLSRVESEAREGIIHPQPLRWGYENDEQITEDLAHYTAQIQPTESSPGTPEVKAAIEARDAMQYEVVQACVDAGVLPATVLNDVAGYVHQQVLAKDKLMQQERESQGNAQKGASFMMERLLGPDVLGKDSDPNASYLEPEILWIADAFKAIRRKQLNDSMIAHYDKYTQFDQEAEQKKKTTRAVAKENDHLVVDRSTISMESANVFDIMQDQFNEQVSEEGKLTNEEKAAAFGDGKGNLVALPSRILKQLEENKAKATPHWVFSTINKVTSTMKGWLLLNPVTQVGWGLRNFYGDGEVTLAAIPSAFKPSNLWKSGKQVWNFYRDPANRDARVDAALMEGAIGSGMTGVELGELEGERQFRQATGKKQGGMLRKAADIGPWYMRTFRGAHQMRENFWRMAAFNAYLDQIESGKLKDFGGSKKANALKIIKHFGKEAGAAYLSRNTLGDYADTTEAGNIMRRSLIPFYAFIEINTKRWPRIAVNAAKAGGLRLAPIVAARLASGYLVAQMWNHIMYPAMFGDDDWKEDLSDDEANGVGINVGRFADGTLARYKDMGTLAEFFETIGINQLISDLPDYYSGAQEPSGAPGKFAKNMIQKFADSLHPALKAIEEHRTLRSTFPDATGPGRPITRAEAFGNLVGLGKQMDAFMGWLKGDGRAMRPHSKFRFLGIGLNYPKREALRDYYSYFERYAEKHDLPEKGSFPISPMRPAKEAATNSDRASFDKWYNVFTEKYGYDSPDKFDRYVERLDPLKRVPPKHREGFLEGLNGKETERVNKARLYAAELRDLMTIWFYDNYDKNPPSNGGMSM
ncbi:MAG: hypothetical protein ACYS7Y_32955, partial [Planctomycetota bacterium]